jgi:hypothetical protein
MSHALNLIIATINDELITRIAAAINDNRPMEYAQRKRKRKS